MFDARPRFSDALGPPRSKDNASDVGLFWVPDLTRGSPLEKFHDSRRYFMNRPNASTSFAICLIAVCTLMAQNPPSERPQTPIKPDMQAPKRPVASAHPEVKRFVGFVLGIDGVQRSGPPPATVFLPTGSDVIYDSTPVMISFTLSNYSGRTVTGRITGNFGGPNFSASSPVNKFASGSS